LKIVDFIVSLVHSSCCSFRLENMRVLMASHSAFLEGLHYPLSVDPLLLLRCRGKVRFWLGDACLIWVHLRHRGLKLRFAVWISVIWLCLGALLLLWNYKLICHYI
jgi:hypothetical protein